MISDVSSWRVINSFQIQDLGIVSCLRLSQARLYIGVSYERSIYLNQEGYRCSRVSIDNRGRGLGSLVYHTSFQVYYVARAPSSTIATRRSKLPVRSKWAVTFDERTNPLIECSFTILDVPTVVSSFTLSLTSFDPSTTKISVDKLNFIEISTISHWVNSPQSL